MRPKLAIAVASLALFVISLNPWTLPAQAPAPLSPEALKVYRKAHTVIDWTPKEIRGRRELRGLQPAGNPSELAGILREAGERVAALIGTLPNVTATESVQWRVSSGTSRDGATGKFLYLLLPKGRTGEETFEEYRTDLQGKEIDYTALKGSPPLTSGFTLALLYFDPHNQAGCRYRYFGRQTLGQQEADVVGFAQIPEGNLHLAEFYDGEHRVPLLFQGLAWIDSRTHEILRLRTDLLAPPPHTSLQRETTCIDYAPVHLPKIAGPMVLPKKVVVDMWQSVEVVKQARVMPTEGISSRHAVIEDPSVGGEYALHCRNVHTYSDYRLFRVESRIAPKS